MALALLTALTLIGQAPDLQGYWLGTLNARARELRLLIHVRSITPPTATLTSIDQNNQPREAGLTIDGRRFKLHSATTIITGELSADGTRLTATFSQNGAEFPITFARVDGPPVLKRPQEPKPPFPYHVEEVSVPSVDGVRLAGTFTRPSSGGPHPAVLLISGSGPQDRDELIFAHKPFLVLGDHLTRNGIAVLRVDDRGAGKSSGSRAAATMEDYAADAAAGVAWLKARADVNPRRIGLIGHSEGGVVAPLVASKSKDVTFLVLIAAPAMTGASVSMLQTERIARAAGATDDQIRVGQAINRRIYDIVAIDQPEAQARAAIRAVLREEFAKMGVTAEGMLALAEKQMEPQIARGLTPWFRHFLTHDPTVSLRALRVPVLALYGSLDVQVPAAENAPLMRGAIASSSDLSDVMVFERLNHLFQTATTGTLEEYGRLEETFAPAALEAITKWVRRAAWQEGRPVVRRPARPEDLRMRGYWSGTISVAGESHDVTLRYTPPERPMLTFARRRVDGLIPLQPTSMRFTPTTLEATFARPAFELVASLRADGHSLDVVLKEHGTERRAVFSRADAPGALKRPQTPRPPFPYDTYDDRIDTGSGILGVTLTLPKGKGPFPGVVLISGTGPQTRDNTFASHRTFAVVADHLTRRGFGVVRYDDRGTGQSSGLFGEMRSTEAEAFDAISVLRYLRAQPEIDTARTGFVGHSEGGLIATIAAGQTDGVGFVVMLGSPAIDGIALALLQHETIARARGGTDARVALERRVRERIYDILRAEPDGAKARDAIAAVFREATRETEAPELLRWLADFKRVMDVAVSQRYSTTLRARMLMDPVPALRALRVPVLALFGDRDVQVPAAENAPPMRAAIAQSSSLSEVRVLPHLNHGFQTAATGSVDEYATIEETLAPAALDAIAAWLARIVR